MSRAPRALPQSTLSMTSAKHFTVRSRALRSTVQTEDAPSQLSQPPARHRQRWQWQRAASRRYRTTARLMTAGRTGGIREEYRSIDSLALRNRTPSGMQHTKARTAARSRMQATTKARTPGTMRPTTSSRRTPPSTDASARASTAVRRRASPSAEEGRASSNRCVRSKMRQARAARGRRERSGRASRSRDLPNRRSR